MTVAIVEYLAAQTPTRASDVRLLTVAQIENEEAQKVKG